MLIIKYTLGRKQSKTVIRNLNWMLRKYLSNNANKIREPGFQQGKQMTVFVKGWWM